MTTSERLGLLEWYAEQGWAVLPLAARGKVPAVGQSWQAWRCARADLAKHFRATPTGTVPNVGLLLGAPSRGLVDVDLDSPEALYWAPKVMPATLTFGRASKPLSHWLYVATNAPPATEQLRDVGAGAAMLLEMRSTGAQTMAPPSVHPSGEAVEWTPDPNAELAHVAAAELRDRVHDVAVLCLVERHVGRAAAQRLLEGQWPVDLHGPALARARNLLGMSPVIARGAGRSGDQAYERARRYLAQLPPAISGSAGHAALWAAAQALVRGFRLSASEALALLRDDYNQRCEPPWSEEELTHKVGDAINKSALPFGYLLGAELQKRRRSP